ncbi:hypothetical protein [Bacillus toyonensis]|uniref:hypothetical protein n=1 Tax=Bacillus toyonensis TaxID=155322 RepID=UPI003018F090
MAHSNTLVNTAEPVGTASKVIEKQIMKPESDYIKAQGSLRKIKEHIESEKRSKRKMQEELYDHDGWMIYDGEWVEVDKQ